MSKNSKNFLTGKFIKRYKRFFVDVQLDSKKIVTAHCPNTGSMMGLLEKDNLVYLTEADDPNRKLKFTLEAIQSNGAMVGVCLLYTSPSPRDREKSRMPSSA